eukprot:scaffold59_cov411-Prasinococcus_capsulatus_cf.AAC.3
MPLTLQLEGNREAQGLPSGGGIGSTVRVKGDAKGVGKLVAVSNARALAMLRLGTLQSSSDTAGDGDMLLQSGHVSITLASDDPEAGETGGGGSATELVGTWNVPSWWPDEWTRVG